METTLYKPFNRRAFVTTAMLVAALGLPLSGIMNHQMQFEPLTTERHFWMSVHNMSAFLFCIFAFSHIVYNWKALTNHMNKMKGISVSREAIFAIMLVVFVVSLFSSHAFHVN